MVAEMPLLNTLPTTDIPSTTCFNSLTRQLNRQYSPSLSHGAKRRGRSAGKPRARVDGLTLAAAPSTQPSAEALFKQRASPDQPRGFHGSLLHSMRRCSPVTPLATRSVANTSRPRGPCTLTDDTWKNKHPLIAKL